MKNVLLITSVPFWEPGRGDAARILSLALHLHKYVNLHIFFISTNPATHDEKKLVSGHFRVGDHLISGVKTTTSSQDEISAFMSILFKKMSIDLCLVEYLYLDWLREAIPVGIPIYLDTHDLVSQRAASFKSHGASHDEVYTLQEECELFEKYDRVIMIQRDEYELVRDVIGDKKLILAPHSITLPRQEIKPKVSRVGFVGSRYSPNIDSINWFHENVWKQADASGATLNIYGAVCDEIDWCNSPAVQCHGLVPDLDGIYGEIDIVINPVLYGAGLKIKNAEALASGLPLVTTDEGARGLGDGVDNAFLVANDAHAFSSHLQRLLNSYDDRVELGKAAARYAKDKFSPDACFGDLIKEMHT